METIDDAALCAQMIKGALEFFDSIRDVRINDPLPQGLSRGMADSLAESLSRHRTKLRRPFEEFLLHSAATMIRWARQMDGGNLNFTAAVESAVKAHFQAQYASHMKWRGEICDLFSAPILDWEFRREGQASFDHDLCPRGREALRIATELFARARGIRMLDPLPPPLDRQTVDRILLHGRQIPPSLKEGFEQGIEGKMRSFATLNPESSPSEIALANIQACVHAFVIAQAFGHLARAPLSVLSSVAPIELINDEPEVEHGHRN